MTKSEEVDLLRRAREILSHPDPARQAWALEHIYILTDFAKDTAIRAEAQSLVRESVVYIRNRGRTALKAVVSGVTFVPISAQILEAWMALAVAL